MTLQQIKQRYGLIGNDEKFNRALEVAMRVAPTDLSVLLSGESGVGKEAFSRIIHDLSRRKHEDFIAVNCGAIPEGTIDSELFGHEKGAFTGAVGSREGYFQVVDGGTIFLDEIGEMPLSTQARLLRVLENGEFIRVGSSTVIKTDVRVVAATNRDLKQRIEKGKFREDLYYRLNTVPVEVPALRERPDDIHLLFRKFAYDFAEQYRTEPVRLDESAQQVLRAYRWPGNIRELKNIAQQVSALSTEQRLDAEQFMEYLPKLRSTQSSLPVLFDGQTGEPDSSGERAMIYKFLFEMKSDINELKAFMLRLAETGNLRADEVRRSDLFQTEHRVDNGMRFLGYASGNHEQTEEGSDELNEERGTRNLPVQLYDNPLFDTRRAYEQPHEEVEESLSLTDMEKTMIRKALKKYKGKRKDAAQELGISERTLYRKIKEYQIEN